MTEGKDDQTTKLDIKVTKTRLYIIQNSGESKVDNLITLMINLRKNPDIKIKLQIHVYYTSQNMMVQGSRLLDKVKGFKLLVEDFLQPLLVTAIEIEV